ncbi:phage portal protein [Pinisolibacter aquiterrae]|uniref:phage portal protein n=1 Tax=Pinisolibacter aquiterrae TaxID=2815579 RepID=UPI001C3D3C07|nr:phage portal protein [Pinisolibacter aquiterrae]MBV5262859.1 phage portal protein [Pinisolibacter aquiterrae]MCC8236427.1 phage portal protein [Pinisolibacter aquiterrae]
MGFLDRFFRRETRSASPDAFLAEHLATRGLGGAASPDVTLSSLAVAARCVGIRSEMLASVGLFAFRRTADGGRERADDLPLYAVLHDQMNPNLAAFEGREFLLRELDTRGNAFARIERNARGQVVALWPEPWGNVGVERLAGGRLRYRISSPYGGTEVLLQDEVLHVRGPTRDGMMGLSPLHIAREAMGFAVGQAETAEGFIRNALRPSGVISFPDKFVQNQEQAARVRQTLREKYQGIGKSGEMMILDGGAKFERISWTPQDAEFLASRKLANEDVARVFGIPPTCVGITDRGTYSNTEQEARALVQNALGPLAARIEAAMMRCLLSDAARRSIYVEHDLSALLRGDVQARFEAYRIGREIGALSPNDVRRRENEPPIANGDVYHQPANWVPLGTQATQTGV